MALGTQTEQQFFKSPTLEELVVCQNIIRSIATSAKEKDYSKEKHCETRESSTNTDSLSRNELPLVQTLRGRSPGRVVGVGKVIAAAAAVVVS